NRTAKSRWSSERMLTQNRCDCAISGCAVAPRLTQINTVGGAAETLAEALAVKPWMRPSCSVVTIATPVAKRRIAARKSSVDARTDADPVTDRHDGRVQIRMVQKSLVERADRRDVRAVGAARRLGGLTVPQQVVHDDDPRAL